MNPKVYVETTVVSYLTAWPSQDVLIAAHQHITRDWWETSRDNFELCASQMVIDEAEAGDEEAAKERMQKLSNATMLEITSEARELAKELLRSHALPAKAADDALHVAIAAVHNVPYLLTWNCRHLANAAMRPIIESVCENNGYQAPIICTPEELMAP
jgi:hypothetical protein